ncbi:hypothetical protein ACFLXD_04120 [Chloroflexota bacterium]
MLVSIVSTSKFGAPYKNFHEKTGWFSSYNWHEPHNRPDLEDRNDRAYFASFNAVVRVYDIGDPFLPREITYYTPSNPKEWMTPERAKAQDSGKTSVTMEDVLVDKQGYIYVADSDMELHVLRCTV